MRRKEDKFVPGMGQQPVDVTETFQKIPQLIFLHLDRADLHLTSESQQ